MGQNYGPFQSELQTNLQWVIDERIHQEKPASLSPWLVGLIVFGGCDPETGLQIPSAFQEGFSHKQCLGAWLKVSALLLTRNCLLDRKVRWLIGDGDDEQQVLVSLIQEHNTIVCNALTLAGFNGDAMKVAIKPIGRVNNVTIAHSAERHELLTHAKTHGQISVQLVAII